MPVFERPPLDTLAPARDRWTPVYLEHGRIEVDDASIKWLAADGTICPIPVATVSAIILGPGTTITHAAVKAASQCNCPLLWLGEDGLRFYAFGITPNHDNSMARIHASAWASPQKRNEIARRMFRHRFPDVPTGGVSIKQLRGMEGRRVKYLYEELGVRFGVTWKGRDYNPSNWSLADNTNRALSAATASHYALTAAVCCSMGFIPQLGFDVFVGTLNSRTHRKVLEFVTRNAPPDFGFLSVSSAPNCQGYIVERFGPEGKSGNRDAEISGLHLIAEDWMNVTSRPF